MRADAFLHGRQPDMAAILSKAGTSREIGPQAWSVDLSEGVRLVARADVSDGWLVLNAPVVNGDIADSARYDWWSWLALGSGLVSPLKLVLTPGSLEPGLRADVPIGATDGDIATRVDEACAAFVSAGAAIGRFASRGTAEGGTLTSDPVPPAGGATLDLATLCADAGWRCVGGDATSPRVDLGVPGRQQLALVEYWNGGLRARAELLRCESASLTRTSRKALGLFLLTASGLVRLARPQVDGSEGSVMVGFEAGGNVASGADGVGHVLSSLSVGCETFGREAQALADEHVARLYLAIRVKEAKEV